MIYTELARILKIFEPEIRVNQDDSNGSQPPVAGERLKPKFGCTVASLPLLQLCSPTDYQRVIRSASAADSWKNYKKSNWKSVEYFPNVER